jgi:hypothetical protein
MLYFKQTQEKMHGLVLRLVSTIQHTERLLVTYTSQSLLSCGVATNPASLVQLLKKKNTPLEVQRPSEADETPIGAPPGILQRLVVV